MLAPSEIGMDLRFYSMRWGSYTRGEIIALRKKMKKIDFFCFFDHMGLRIHVASLVRVRPLNAAWHGG